MIAVAFYEANMTGRIKLNNLAKKIRLQGQF